MNIKQLSKQDTSTSLTNTSAGSQCIGLYIPTSTTSAWTLCTVDENILLSVIATYSPVKSMNTTKSSAVNWSIRLIEVLRQGHLHQRRYCIHVFISNPEISAKCQDKMYISIISYAMELDPHARVLNARWRRPILTTCMPIPRICICNA
jgi:hypothetical protein